MLFSVLEIWIRLHLSSWCGFWQFDVTSLFPVLIPGSPIPKEQRSRSPSTRVMTVRTQGTRRTSTASRASPSAGTAPSRGPRSPTSSPAGAADSPSKIFTLYFHCSASLQHYSLSGVQVVPEDVNTSVLTLPFCLDPRGRRRVCRSFWSRRTAIGSSRGRTSADTTAFTSTATAACRSGLRKWKWTARTRGTRTGSKRRPSRLVHSWRSR